MSSIFDEFTGKYAVNKTLRFRLIPQGKTEENIKKANIIGSQWENNENQAFGKDAVRAKNYKIVKEVINEVHRVFIQEVLSQSNIKQDIKSDNLIEFYTAWKQKQSDLNKYHEQKKEYQFQLAEGLEKLFKKTTKDWKNKYPGLKISKNQDEDDKKPFSFLAPAKLLLKKVANQSTLEQMIDQKVIKPNIQKDDGSSYTKNDLKEAIGSFDKFATYFEGFRKNREHIYNIPKKDKNGRYTKLKAGSVAHRLFECNLLFHFINIEKWQIIQNSIDQSEDHIKPHFQTAISNIETIFKINLSDLFQPASFLKYLSQSGIDHYNQILGGPPAKEGEEKQKGLNGIINEMQQKSQSNRKKFPIMQEFYKQILSKDDHRFIDVFDNDKEMLKAIKDFYQTFQSEDLLNKLKIDIEKHFESLIDSDLKEHYLNRDTIRTFSTHIFEEQENSDDLRLKESWKILDNWWIKYVDEKRQTDQGNPLSKNVKDKEYKKKSLSFLEIQEILQYMREEGEISHLKKEYQGKNPLSILKTYIINRIDELITKGWKNQDKEDKKGIKNAWKELNKSGILNRKALNKNEKDQQVNLIKEFLDACSFLHRFIRSLQTRDKDLPKTAIPNEDWQKILEHFNHKLSVMNLYNKVRNRITKKPYNLDKIKVNFEKSNLLGGWSQDENNHYQYNAILLRKDDLFYLGIINKNNKKNIFQKSNKNQKQLKDSSDDYYDKMIYNSLDIKKQFPRIFQPTDEDKQTDESHIQFMIKKLKKHDNWMKKFQFQIKKFNEYENFDAFCDDLQKQAYNIKFVEKISKFYIDKCIQDEKLYLFQIYNKDFSQKKKSKGKDNLHTLYWKSLFEENTIHKLNGKGELFFRPTSLQKKVTHSKNRSIENKNPNNLKKESVFSYDLIKDKRFTEDQFFFHIPITLNYKNNEKKDMNLEVNKFLKHYNENINIIGIDRGESNLLYYSVVDQNGNIIEQDHVNTINNSYIDENNQQIFVKCDYHEKLNEIEEDRKKSRKNWSKIENIKELKSGYLSQVVHQISKLIIKYNAIVVLEDLNNEFKNFRKKVEKQIYQKFEKTLIDKLNYLVFKETPLEQKGHYFNAYQLTAPFKSFEKLDKQIGILFYTTAPYTSTTDPVTGFLKNVYYDNTNIEDAQEFWKNFDSIRFNKNKNYFEFTYTIGKIKSRQFNKEKGEDQAKQKRWTVCSCVTRSYYDRNQKKSICLDIHEKIIKELSNQKNITYNNEKCFKDQLAQNSDLKFHKEMIRYFSFILNIRVKDDDKIDNREKDYILSPVEPFFDSRKANEDKLPIDSDANGAYNIARKGVLILEQIRKAESIDQKFKLKPVNKKDWQDYVQSEDIVEKQKSKL